MRTASWHRDSNTSDSRLFCQYFLLLHFSLHVTCRNKHSDCFTSTRTNKHMYGPSDFSFPHRPFKQFKTYTWRLHPEEFADHTLPRNNIKSTSRKSKSRFFKFRQCLSNCRSLSWSNATATAPASQAGHPGILATDTKFFIWETAFDALIDSAPISGQHKCISCTNT